VAAGEGSGLWRRLGQAGAIAGGIASGGLLPIGLAVGSAAFSEWQASRARKWQERMSSTAHQREVADMKAAGINPMFSARTGGASSPPGAMAPPPRMLEAASAKAQIELMQAQAGLVDAQRIETTIRARETEQGTGSRLAILSDESALRAMDVSQRRELFQAQIAEIKARTQASVSGALGADQVRRLNELAEKGALNEADWQELIRTGGPFMRSLYQAAQIFNLVTGGLRR